MESDDEICQILEGSWAGLFSSYAVELVFYRIPHGSYKSLKGNFVVSNNWVAKDSKEGVKK